MSFKNKVLVKKIIGYCSLPIRIIILIIIIVRTRQYAEPIGFKEHFLFNLEGYILFGVLTLESFVREFYWKKILNKDAEKEYVNRFKYGADLEGYKYDESKDALIAEDGTIIYCSAPRDIPINLLGLHLELTRNELFYCSNVGNEEIKKMLSEIKERNSKDYSERVNAVNIKRNVIGKKINKVTKVLVVNSLLMIIVALIIMYIGEYQNALENRVFLTLVGFLIISLIIMIIGCFYKQILKNKYDNTFFDY